MFSIFLNFNIELMIFAIFSLVCIVYISTSTKNTIECAKTVCSSVMKKNSMRVKGLKRSMTKDGYLQHDVSDASLIFGRVHLLL